MDIYEKMISALNIFRQYPGQRDFIAEHDVIYAGPDPSVVSATDKNRLEALGWFVDPYGCFGYYT